MRAVLAVAIAVLCFGCAACVPTDFKKSEAADGAVLTTLVQRYQLDAGSVDQAEAWQRLAEISGNMELRNRWLRGESVDWASTQAKEVTK
jgi:hypothetical protein